MRAKVFKIRKCSKKLLNILTTLYFFGQRQP